MKKKFSHGQAANAAGSATKTLVVSGVGMKEGGILTVLREFVSAAENILSDEWRIVVLAHKRDLLTCQRAEVREYPAIKASWLKRMWFELWTSRKLAEELNAEVWFAMHDITPLVRAPRQYVYCHNPTPFTRPTLRAFRFDRVFVIHSLLYRYIYSLNIRRNAKVFVQQGWIRDKFIKDFGARDVVVSRPVEIEAKARPAPAGNFIRKSVLKRWLYPTFPRHFKNIEVIGQALERLEKTTPEWAGEVMVTIDGSENEYSRWICERFGKLRSLRLIGRQEASEMARLYSEVDGLLFSSKLETWGLPISEAQTHDLALLVAEREYAHETVGRYHSVSFFDPDDPVELAQLLLGLSKGEVEIGSTEDAKIEAEYVVAGWENLVREVCN
jgi:glycosyltransferase involved in cell wall biosynthesis